MSLPEKKEKNNTEKLPQGIDLSPETVKKYIAKGATDEELFMFLGICKSYGLNPFKREIHFIKYDQKSPASIVVGYETYLKRAVATEKLDGWRVWIEGRGEEMKAVIEIKRKDWSEPFRWEVHRREFDTGKSSWKKMPTFMLKKVAIAQGFRLAFPEDLGGMPYIPEEMPEGTVIGAEVMQEPAQGEKEQSARESLKEEFLELFKQLNWTREHGKAFLKNNFDKEATSDLTDDEFAKLIDLMKEELKKAEENERLKTAELWKEIHKIIEQTNVTWDGVVDYVREKYKKKPDDMSYDEVKELIDFMKETAIPV